MRANKIHKNVLITKIRIFVQLRSFFAWESRIFVKNCSRVECLMTNEIFEPTIEISGH